MNKSEKPGSVMAYSSILMAEKCSEELAKRLGGKPKDYLVIDDAFVEKKPKKFIWQSMQYPKWLILKRLEKQ